MVCFPRLTRVVEKYMRSHIYQRIKPEQKSLLLSTTIAEEGNVRT